MDEFMQQLFTGLSNGMVYGGLALALCVVFQGTGVLNFGQGEMATFSTLVVWQLLQFGTPFWVALPIVIVVSFIAGMGIERILIRPVEGSSELSLLMVTLGLFLGLNAIMGFIWGFHSKQVPSPFGAGVIAIGESYLTWQQLGAMATILVVVLITTLVFRFTTVGLRMRAASENPVSSRLLSINVGRQLMIGWGIAAAVGAVAGAMSAPIVGTGPDMFRNTVLLAFAAAAFGGFTNRIGAVVGGIVVGVGTSLAATYIPGLGGDLSIVVPFIFIILILLLRPQGLFAATVKSRA
ncbi:branched-chain amino acid ABC transporter permease [Leucobacter weissii]|uniref:Branched-chain amino acid ABC transporter permease n=1 Tax=Leucobacter weissii TaxID=1983706 RepID=A0A939MIV2_9MICO|nr:branched-chain amino acid ABC transporter permease [Leucobacter weissii]MBO1901538.1 branched-chain amino acid ABC transporter permease [Leucobacter weissii]